ncbi:MAG TPA: hypothetical protein VE596_06075 [Gaiellaceae bacterium]|jgi:hypothetical protein|nr:hypothetical protein [Gaiellaceae bacterium]
MVPPDDLAAVEEAIYDQSFRTLDEQARILEGLRSRAGTLASVATLTTGFVGGLASMLRGTQHSSHGTLRWIAVALYLLVIVLSLLIASPSHRWAFGHHPERLLAVYTDPRHSRTLAEFRCTIASYNGRNCERNGRQLARLSASFAVASVVFVVELILWLWELAK